jgi:hypothetical protein
LIRSKVIRKSAVTFAKIPFCGGSQTDRQTDGQTDTQRNYNIGLTSDEALDGRIESGVRSPLADRGLA